MGQGSIPPDKEVDRLRERNEALEWENSALREGLKAVREGIRIFDTCLSEKERAQFLRTVSGICDAKTAGFGQYVRRYLDG